MAYTLAEANQRIDKLEAERDALIAELEAKPCDRCGSTDRSLDADFHCSTCYAELEKEVERLRGLLDLAVRGCGSMIWLSNNRHHFEGLSESALGFFDAAARDCARAYDANKAAEAGEGE